MCFRSTSAGAPVGDGAGSRVKEASGTSVLAPAAAVTNDHGHSVLKQNPHLFSRFWRSKVQNGFHWAKFKVVAWLHFFWRLQGASIFLLFQHLEATYIPWPRPRGFFHLRSQTYITLTSASVVTSGSLTSAFLPPP